MAAGLGHSHARRVLRSPAGYAIPAVDGSVDGFIDGVGSGGPRFSHHLSFAGTRHSRVIIASASSSMST
jgi:hypothetical protein